MLLLIILTVRDLTAFAAAGFVIALRSLPGWSVGALVGVMLFLIVHLGTAIWFGSRVNSQVAQLISTSELMAAELKKLSALDGRIQVIESWMNRAELDARDALKAAAEMGRHQV